MQAVLDEAIEHFWESLLDEVNAAYATLRSNPKAGRKNSLSALCGIRHSPTASSTNERH